MENMMKIKEAMEYMNGWNPKKQPTINGYCIEGRVPCMRQGDMWYIEKTYIQDAVKWRSTVLTTDDLLWMNPDFIELSEYDKAQCIRNVSRQTAEYLEPENEYSILFAGRFIANEHLELVAKMVKDIAKQYADRAKKIPVALAAEKMGLSVYQVKRMIGEGKIKAEVVKNNWYIPETSLQEFLDEQKKYTGFYDLVNEVLPEVKTTFNIEDRTQRALLNNAVRNSKLGYLLVERKDTGLHGDRRNSYYVPSNSNELVKEFIRKYLKQCGFADERLEMFAEDNYWGSHPKTWEALMVFSDKKLPNGMVALMETIMETLDSEIMDAEDEEIDNMIDYAINAELEIYQQYTSMFLKFIANRYDCRYSLVADYRTGKAHQRTENTTPYPMNVYSVFAQMNFNDEYIKEHRFVEKAVKDEKMAFLWLRNCMHYTSMWREYDYMNQIPVVRLKMSKKELKEKLLSGEFGEKEADELSVLLEMAIMENGSSPHKTGNEKLRVHFSEPLRPVIGLAYACCLLHAYDEYIQGMRLNISVYKEFYGHDYIRLFGMKPFMNRRANKSYADALVTITERTNDNEHKVRGYIIAGYARGHSMKSGQIPSATHNYLQYKLDGLSDSEIIKMLLDMGTCSFVVHMILEAIYGDSYKRLPVEHQAEIVKESGLTANTADKLSAAVLKSYRRSKKLAEELLDSYPTLEGQKKACKDALINIIEGKATSKDDGISCLNLAFLRPCNEPKCEHCPGCENAILHKSALFTVFNVLEDTYKKLRNAKTEGSARKYQALIDNRYLPATIELLSFCKDKYGMDITEAKDKIYRLIMNDERRDD